MLKSERTWGMNKNITQVYSSMHDMVLNLLTKPFQGKVFRKHHDTLLGLENCDYTSSYTKYTMTNNGIQ